MKTLLSILNESKNLKQIKDIKLSNASSLPRADNPNNLVIARVKSDEHNHLYVTYHTSAGKERKWNDLDRNDKLYLSQLHTQVQEFVDDYNSKNKNNPYHLWSY